MTNLDLILNGYVPVAQLPKVKQDIKEFFSNYVSANVEDYRAISKLKRKISEL